MSHKACILILEDNPTELDIFKLKIKKYLSPGDTVFDAKSGQEAIEIIQRAKGLDRPCIFILDLNMPGELKGFDVLEWIRSQEEYATCAVIILTSSDDDRDRDKAFRLGATEFCTKPRTGIQTTVLLKQILGRYRDRAHSDGLRDTMETRIRKAGGDNGK